MVTHGDFYGSLQVHFTDREVMFIKLYPFHFVKQFV